MAFPEEDDIVSIYERACRMAGTTASSRISRELTNNRVFLDSAGLNTQDIKAVCVALLNHSTISRLDLSGNELSRQAVQYLCELIEENVFITSLQNHNLRELRLSYCDIDEEGGFILSKALEDTNLEVLDLSWNHLRQKGATAFCMALADNDSIRELDLSWNGLGREGCAGLEASLAKNRYLVQLNLECNRIGSVSLGHLLKGVEKNSGLETLILSTNPLSTDDAKLIASVLKSAPKSAIKVVDIFDVTVDDDFVAMQEELEERGISIYYGNILHRPKKEIKAGPRTLGSFDPILVLFEYMKQQNLRLIDLFRSLDVNRDNAISREELRNGFMSLNMHLPEGVFSAAFNKLDLNSNNLIDIDELKNAHRRVIRQTALMMLRSQRQEQQKDQDMGAGGDRRSDRVDLLHEFQKLVKEATAKRKTVKLKDESDDDASGGDHGGRKLPIRPGAIRRNSSLLPGSARNRRPSSGAALININQGQQVGNQSEGQRSQVGGQG
ncbi:leucine-rich repeat-containing protein 74a-like [Plakobranchus ocellatus]|uniref:Leucine-rich repeat-containing protein 74a-like n=1 Tax=Plakobranchus ocellatus TaxID=259542 RepID=A0AAV3Y3G7_9GAST|nr:leucine-rich repeat-containing protein 74a-like [Plakobranchus ocellatus]